MKYIIKQALTFTLTLALVTTMCFGAMGPAKAYAGSIYPALSVYDGDQLVKKYSVDDLKAIAKAEGDKKYKFSGYNRNPSFYTFGDANAKDYVKECIGPTVAGILKDAGVTYTDQQLIKFAAPDGVTEAFTAADLFRDRYYFPNGKTGTALGAAAPEESYAGAEPVEPIIDLYHTEEDDSVLRFGQVAPNEQNNSAYVKYVADGGSIIISDPPTAAWEDITTANYNGGEILPETVLEFELPKSMSGKKVAAYYTTDGSEPGYGDAIYNYDKYGGVRTIETPDSEGPFVIKFRVIGYGKLESNTTTFTYEVKDVAVAKPATFNVTADSTAATLNWGAVEGASGYHILKLNAASGKYEEYADVKEGTTYSDTAVTYGQECSYQVRAYVALTSGQMVYGSAAAKQTVTIPQPPAPEEPEKPADPEEPEKPAPTKPAKVTLSSVAKTGYGGIQIKWKKVTDANGYQIWRYDAVSKKYTLAKTITSGSTVSWKNTGLKTGRKYTYKIRAYKVLEDGTKLYGSYSSTKAATPALNKPVISKLTPGSKSITVKWKKVDGASGYAIYRATSKNGKYTCVKTITKGSTVSWKNTKLKKGKTYYYKVKAYRTVDKKKVYSSYSSVKYIKSK